MVTRTRLRAEDLWQLPAFEGQRELVRGELVEMPPPGFRHGSLAVRMALLLELHAQPRGSGEVAVEAGYVLARDPDTVRGPDVSFVLAGRVPAAGPPVGFWEGPPDLAVEIRSPDDRPGKVARSVDDYLEAGTRLVWVVDPEARTVTVHALGRTSEVLTTADILTGGDVLPDLEIVVGLIFE